MFVLTTWNKEHGESEVHAVSATPEALELRAAEMFEDLTEDNECETSELVWVVVGPNSLELEARVDWGWGDDEVWRIQSVDVI